jgi:hypothetical protein
MRNGAKIVLAGFLAVLAAGGVAAVAAASVDTRTIGRTNPQRAANYRLPWFNFSETYTDGEILGVVIGSTRDEAIQAAERAGLTVDTSGWGDNRAGGADLYRKSALRGAMSRQPHLDYFDKADTKRGMTIRFRDDRVVSVSVYYINSEAI